MRANRPLFRRYVRRPRLTRLLDDTAARTILLVAPAGYGKTILASEWLSTKERVAWYSTNSGSADVVGFAVGLAQAVDPIAPEAAEVLGRAAAHSGAPEAEAPRLAELLAERLHDWPDEAWLAIDDYQLLADSEPVETFMEHLLQLAPIQLLVASRRRPGWASARRVLYGEMLEITRSHLAMTNLEAAEILAGLQPAKVKRLVVQAGGWPVVIGLAALSASASAPGERVSDALFRYFADEVLRRQPPPLQELMLMASVPARVDTEIARTVLGFDEADDLLRRLRDDGLLHGSEEDGFHFHPLLRDFLRRRLERDQPELLTTVNARALAHAKARHQWDDAFELALRARQPNEAAQIVGEAAPELLASGRLETLDRWLKACGEEAIRNTAALLARAELLLRLDRLSEAHAVARQLAESLSPDDERAARAWNLAGLAVHLLSDDRQSLEYHKRARDVAVDDHELKYALFGAFIAAIELESDDAGVYLDELEPRVEELDDRLRLAIGRIQLGFHSGTCKGVWEAVEPLLPLAEHSGNPMRLSAFLKDAAELALARGDYSVARTIASRATDLCRDLHLDFATGLCLARRADAETGLRQFRRAKSTIDEASRFLAQHANPSMQVYRLNSLMKLALARRNFDRAIDYAEQLPAGELINKASHGTFLGLLALAEACSGRAPEAREHARRALETTRAMEAQGLARLAEFVAAIAAGAPERELRPAARQVVLECAAREYRDGLVIAYRAEPRLLDLAPDDPLIRSIVQESMLRSNDVDLARAAGIPVASHEQNGLTQREAEVLELMAQGLSNAEIAARLYIALGTTKVHVHHILEKLGVENRMQAMLAFNEGAPAAPHEAQRA